ncbi:glycosyltransferase [Actinacidiphila yeochonensis]|uniref:glycosyltransferase n=1 Tax=Actinacidiphila yeochonensis TaxID=89050 RepID=UPI002AFF288D|nr:glycosyltransferase [Actinacidiphila yeochonensis]
MSEVRVLSIYEGFFSGGARILHSDVVLGLHGGAQRHSVLSVEGEMNREATRQPMEEDACYRSLTAAGVPVTALRRGSDAAGPAAGMTAFTAAELAATARATAAADVVLSLKEQPLALLNQAGLPLRPVVVCLHRSDPENQGPALDALLAGVAAGRVQACVCCAESTRRAYAAAGVPAEILHVIPNGVDLLRFRPDPVRRAQVRAALGIPAQAPLVTFAARWAAMKNVPLFLASARAYLRRSPDARVLMCGAGMTAANPGLRAEIAAALGDEPWLAERMLTLGVRADMEALYAASDVVSLTSSSGEAAPLCLIEGMMCGAVPVATDVGDCADLVAGRGLLTPPDREAIAAAWTEAVERAPLFAPALEACREQFSRTRMVAAYGALIDQVHQGAPLSAQPEPL